MLNSLGDPYSFFLAESLATQYNDLVTGEFGGLGITITKNTDGYVYVASTVSGAPAARAGIMTGDYITAVNGEDIRPLTSDEAVRRLRGPQGTSVTINVLRGEIRFELSIVREIIEIESVQSALIGDDNEIGYVNILTFTPRTPDAMRTAVTRLSSEGARAFIFDVRSNGGGSYEAVVSMANDLLDSGTIVSIQARNSRHNRVEQANSRTIIDVNVPIVVLINEGSASASEIFAGALQDNNRATIIGNTSFGKAQVQSLFPLVNDFSQSFKITTAFYYTPGGVNIDNEGISPDIYIEGIYWNDEAQNNYVALMLSEQLAYFRTLGRLATVSELDGLVAVMQAEGNILPPIFIKKVASEVAALSMQDNRPIFFLEFDEALQKAVGFLEKIIVNN